MPLSQQEAHCIELACKHLSLMFGSTFTIESYPDETYRNEPAPEVIVTDGYNKAAIEVKRLEKDELHEKYLPSLLSNRRFLAPSYGGHYTLIPPVDLRMPLDQALRRLLRKEINRLAPTLAPGVPGALRVPRQGHIEVVKYRGEGDLWCEHAGDRSAGVLLAPLSQMVRGSFMLHDKGWQHSFFTSEGKKAFHVAVVDACHKALNGVTTPFEWYEEWKLWKDEDRSPRGKDDDGVGIIASMEARDVMKQVEQRVRNAVDDAEKKFATRQWADLHVLTLETSPHDHTQQLKETVAVLMSKYPKNIDMVFLVVGDLLTKCYPTAS